MSLINNEIEIQNFALPQLQAGEYKLSVTQEVQVKEAGQSPFTKNFSFHVSAPRFRLLPSDIYSAYPLDGSMGKYQKTLPHIVFNDRFLPWARSIDPDFKARKNGALPWMALLLIEEKEMQEYRIKIENVLLADLCGSESPTLLYPLSSKEQFEAAEKIEINGANEKDRHSYQVVDIPLSLFNDIAPTKNEMELLAHVRHADTSAKESSIANTSGWLSLMLCNRLPAVGKNYVFLVSLAGYGGILATTGNAALMDEKRLEKDAKIRLPVLSQWSFEAEGGDFEALAENLSRNTDLLKARVPVQEGNTQLLSILNKGYIPLKHHMRNGQEKVSWYRGPLVAEDANTINDARFFNADSAYRYDEKTGMLDASYAAAWQLGRLLGLQSATFRKGIESWNTNPAKEVILKETRNELNRYFDNMLVFDAEEPTKDELSVNEAAAHTESDLLMNTLLLEIFKNIPL